MTLGTIGHPFSGLPLTPGTDKRKIGAPAQLKGLFKLLGGAAEILLVEVDLRQETMEGRKVFSFEADQIQFFESLVEHLQPQAELGVKESDHVIVGISLERLLIDYSQR